MNGFYEIDFLNVGTGKSGDAIPLRYSSDGITRIHVTDGGYLDTGDLMVNHIDQYYDSPSHIDAVIVTHSDSDHVGGLKKLFEKYEIGELWMLRPWCYAEDLIERFQRFSSVNGLIMRLKEIYPNIVELEQLAEEHDVAIREPFQGQKIGEFHVLAPSKNRYLDLVVNSEKTPEATKETNIPLTERASKFVGKVVSLLVSSWGEEYFPDEDTSPENNMSVIQYACLCDHKILLTGDAGRTALDEAANYASTVGLNLPGVDKIQVPHHGSRHNVSSEVLDRWLGQKSPTQPESTEFTAIVSAAKDDKDHPRKSVVRAFMHRGGRVISTEGQSIRTHCNAPSRSGWSPLTPLPYPEEQEN